MELTLLQAKMDRRSVHKAYVLRAQDKERLLFSFAFSLNIIT